MINRMLPLLFIFFFITINIHSQTNTLVFKGALIYPISGEPIENGVLVVKDRKIVSVGTADKVSIPSGAEVRDVNGKVILPGLVDTHSHIGEGSGGDASSPTNPEVRILDAIDPQSDTFKKALAGGITTVNVMPGSGHLMSGQTAYLKLRKSNTINGMLFCDDLNTGICGGMKMANGTNPISAPPFPGTRAKSASIVRQLFIKAQEYKKKLDEGKKDKDKVPEHNLEMEALVQVLNGERVVHFHTHRADDILTVLRLSKEFGFKVVLQHVTEGWKVADEIAEAGVPCSIIILDSPGGKYETIDMNYANGAILEKAGIDVAFHTDDGITDSRLLIRSAALGVRAGMSRNKALEALTLAGARMLNLQDRVGSLEAGKDADFIILSGDPLSVYTKVEQTWIEGEKVFDLSNPEDKKFATGGYEVFRGDYEHTDNCGGVQ